MQVLEVRAAFFLGNCLLKCRGAPRRAEGWAGAPRRRNNVFS